ncbi:LacI family DNA-binding transcriptional regulator [Aureimonas sp. AU12]|uniref:LacI family DNA-binding transcriptional regulator n=1 Tax=Aureimonas sp. AU12 TaxID=1638161 RepID=UPI000783526B|nr:LacI family DNA-binding transcriptional regulator [Aureimonas sp. AU12]
MATIRDVARLAGVSISTVSLALRDASRVSLQTQERIAEAIRDIGYVANPIAQTLKSGRSRLIGIIFGNVTNPFFGEILQKVERAALERDHLVIVSESRFDPERELAILSHLVGQRVSGLILVPHGRGERYLNYLRRLDRPLVTLDHRVEGLPADFVGSDNHLASAMLTEHMIRYGHRRIAHIAGPSGLWTADERKRGFLDTMATAGLGVDDAMVVHGDYEAEMGYGLAMRLLTSASRPTAILAANNTTALGVLQAIDDLGLRCPQHISLTCIDDVPWSKIIKPRLTMAVQSTSDIADIASSWLFDRIDQSVATAPPPRERLLMPKLVVGQSCAPP